MKNFLEFNFNNVVIFVLGFFIILNFVTIQCRLYKLEQSVNVSYCPTCNQIIRGVY